MKPMDILRKKRFGEELSVEEIRAFANGVVDGSFADYQAAALLMAICINGMTDRETLALTMAMTHSGETLDLSDIPGVKADKHSTGGVGDTTSLILTPLVAACGVKVAKMSGRGLGFTGGTLDKLEAIPGLSTAVEAERFRKIVCELGCAIIGQTAELAPADKVLYALRDVTATVDCRPLIISSILSKKLAAGCDVVVLDVKTGSGAMMKSPEEARLLAEDMVRIGNGSGRRFSALITDMNQPLGMYIGNALEVEEAIHVLAGRAQGRLKTVAMTLGAHILKNSGIAQTVEDGIRKMEEKLASGEGLERLGAMIAAQGGDARVVRDVSLLPKAERLVEVAAHRAGFIGAMRTDEIGEAARMLGAGRERKGDEIDPAVGIVMKKSIGERVEVGEPLCVLHVGAASDAEGAARRVREAIQIADGPVCAPELIYSVVE